MKIFAFKNFLEKIRKKLIKLGFKEVINPIIIPESEIYKQYGCEAPIILDRIFYLAGLPRPDIGISDKLKKILEDKHIKIEEFKAFLREYRKGKIESDEFVEELKKRFNINYELIYPHIKEFLNLTPIPSKLTLRSHMTGSWFLTLKEYLKYYDPPVKLFSIDWVFRREQKEDKNHLRYYHSISIVTTEDKSIIDKILTTIGIKKYEIKEKEPANYYEKEWEVYLNGTEIATFGYYSKRALKNYGINHRILNMGIGAERLYCVLNKINDIRLIHQEYKILTDKEILNNLHPKHVAKNQELVKFLVNKVLEYKDKVGPFKELIYNQEIKIYLYEPENKKFLGPGGLNYITVKNNNIIVSKKGKYLLLELIINKLVYLIENGFSGHFKVRWVRNLSDCNLELKIQKKFNKLGGKVDVLSPVFLDLIIER